MAAAGLLARARLDLGGLLADGVELLEHRSELALELVAGRGHADCLRGPTGRREDAPEALQERRHARHGRHPSAGGASR